MASSYIVIPDNGLENPLISTVFTNESEDDPDICENSEKKNTIPNFDKAKEDIKKSRLFTKSQIKHFNELIDSLIDQGSNFDGISSIHIISQSTSDFKKVHYVEIDNISVCSTQTSKIFIECNPEKFEKNNNSLVKKIISDSNCSIFSSILSSVTTFNCISYALLCTMISYRKNGCITDNITKYSLLFPLQIIVTGTICNVIGNAFCYFYPGSKRYHAPKVAYNGVIAYINYILITHRH